MKPELVGEIVHLALKYPSLRLCQLIVNAIPPEEAERRGNDLYYIEDGQLLQWFREFEARAKFDVQAFLNRERCNREQDGEQSG